MDQFKEFIETAVKLYTLAPSLFLWLGGFLVTLIGTTWTLSWFMRGYKAESEVAKKDAEVAGKAAELAKKDAEVARKDIEITGVKGEMAVLAQRLALAQEQQKAAEAEAEKFAKELAELEKAPAPQSKEFAELTKQLELTLGRLVTANSAVTGTLNFKGSGTGLPSASEYELTPLDESMGRHLPPSR